MRSIWVFLGLLNFGSALNQCVLIWGVLVFFGRRVKFFDHQVGNVVVHCDSESAFVIVSGKVYA